MGKTASGAVWLDANKTSPFEFFQYWRNIDDEDVNKCLKLLTFISLEQTKEMEKVLKKPATVTYDALGHLVGDSVTLEMNQLGSVISQLPEQELSVGSKWDFNKVQNVNGTMVSMNMEYTVTNISKKSIELSVNGSTESKDVTGTHNGTVSIDPKTGLVTSSNIKMNLSMTVNEQGLSIPVTMTGTTTTTLK